MKRTYQQILFGETYPWFPWTHETIGGRLVLKEDVQKAENAYLHNIIAVRQEKKLGAAAKFFYS